MFPDHFPTLWNRQTGRLVGNRGHRPHDVDLIGEDTGVGRDGPRNTFTPPDRREQCG